MERDPFSRFIGEMLDAKQFSGLDDDVRQQLETDLKASMLDQIDRAVIDALPEDRVSGLNVLLDEGADEQNVQAYITESGVDVQRVTLEAMLRFRDLYLGEAQSTE